MVLFLGSMLLIGTALKFILWYLYFCDLSDLKPIALNFALYLYFNMTLMLWILFGPYLENYAVITYFNYKILLILFIKD